MLTIDMTAQQARAAAALLQQALGSLEELPSYETLEALVLACRALRTAADAPETPEPAKRSRAAKNWGPEPDDDGEGVAPSPVIEAARLKRQTLERLSAYVSGRPSAVGQVAGASGLPNETVARMLIRERFPVELWRQVAAALDKLEKEVDKNDG